MPVEYVVIKPDASYGNYIRPSQPSIIGGARIGKRTIPYKLTVLTDDAFITKDQL